MGNDVVRQEQGMENNVVRQERRIMWCDRNGEWRMMW